MEQMTNASAMQAIENLFNALNTAYWDTDEIVRRDFVFGITCELGSELKEMSKLNEKEREVNYAPITSEFHSSLKKINKLYPYLKHWFPRESTLDKLYESISALNPLLISAKS